MSSTTTPSWARLVVRALVPVALVALELARETLTTNASPTTRCNHHCS